MAYRAGSVFSAQVTGSSQTETTPGGLAGTGPLAAVLLAIRNEVSGSGLRSAPCRLRM
jgi:hypothetical protein